MLANMTQEQTNKENREHCKRIALDLEAYADGRVYRCPECGEAIEWNNDNYNSEGANYTCSECGAVVEECELEALSLYDFFEDCLDIEYRVDGYKELRGVRIMVTCGGPNIYIDTATKAVELYWWRDRASYPISIDAVEAVDEWAAELWGCTQ